MTLVSAEGKSAVEIHEALIRGLGLAGKPVVPDSGAHQGRQAACADQDR